MDNKEKLKALDAAISKIEKDYGKGSVMKLGDKTALDVDVIHTGSISLDKALGVGGIPFLSLEPLFVRVPFLLSPFYPCVVE